MRKFILCALLSIPSLAVAREGSYDIEYATMVPVGIICSTGTVTRWNPVAPFDTATFPVAGYRILNQDSADSVWLGGTNVSTTSATTAQLGHLGERLIAGASASYPMGFKNRVRRLGLEAQYCKAADAAGAAGVVISVLWFGY